MIVSETSSEISPKLQFSCTGTKAASERSKRSPERSMRPPAGPTALALRSARPKGTIAATVQVAPSTGVSKVYCAAARFSTRSRSSPTRACPPSTARPTEPLWIQTVSATTSPGLGGTASSRSPVAPGR